MKDKITLSKLESLLLKACDILRGKMEANEYKEFVFGMIFLKRLSDKFDEERKELRKNYEDKGLKEELIEKQLNKPQQYKFFVPEGSRWENIRHLKKDVGNNLNTALHALEDNNPNTLEGVLKHINFNRKVGQSSLDDATLVEFIQHFDTIPMKDEDFEFPDLIGAAYEYLLKFFADSAGKKGGEFFTPPEVVRLAVNIVEPKQGMTVYDPCVGSGGMLIQAKDYVEETGGNTRDMGFYGQELAGATWAMCKMNMILHDILSADIYNGDTIKEPLHMEKDGELKRFDRIVTNPPFSQNYSKQGMEFKERFKYGYCPESGKKADLMFVQHMISSLKEDGKMATVMPHGVLFRGSKEKEIREGIIKDGILEAVIGLPENLFYGTGIPACILVINKNGTRDRNKVLFINADREYKEGRNQNHLRPEDIEKITHVYKQKLEVDKYSKLVSIEELEENDFNLNIRRYVDNTPDPEPHDVRAHLIGGVPKKEVDQKKDMLHAHGLDIYKLFTKKDEDYFDFASTLGNKEEIKSVIENDNGVTDKEKEILNQLSTWWQENRDRLVELPKTKDVFAVRQSFMDSFVKTFSGYNMLSLHEVEGAFVNFWEQLKADLKSIAASGWTPTLIPDDEIIASQFPEVNEKQKENEERLQELESMFAEAETKEIDDIEEEDNLGLLPKELVKELKNKKKELNGEIKSLKKNELKPLQETLKEIQKAKEETGYSKEDIEAKINRVKNEIDEYQKEITSIDEKLEEHSKLEEEMKNLKSELKSIEKQKNELADKAREKITDEEAKNLIMQKFYEVLEAELKRYMKNHLLEIISYIEKLWDKYKVTARDIEKERDEEAHKLESFLKELGYVK
ncbi:type I restriction-modification system subunit M [Natranaerobius trueperi]|nr:type I restriction-modification system subunit M [Natranaerobius trueperi]